MGDVYFPAAIDPVDWIVVFRPTSASWLVRTFVPGRFKHVSAFAYLPGLKVWVTYDVGFDGTKIVVIPDGPQVNTVLAPWLADCTLVRMKRKCAARSSIALFGWCAPSIARLIGLSGGTLRPMALYHHCLRNGGVIIGQERTINYAAATAAG